MGTAKNLLGILFFFVVMRMLGTIFLSEKFPNENFFISLIFQSAAILLTIVFCQILKAVPRNEIRTLLSSTLRPFHIFYAAVVGGAILLFFVGENAIEVLVMSHFNQQGVCNTWSVCLRQKEIYNFFSIKVISFLLVACVISPLCEEIFFRGFLLKAYLLKKGSIYSVFLVSFIFTLLHFSNQYLIGFFVFSLVQCAFYLKFKSIWFCFFVHAFYNFMAFLKNYTFAEFFLKPEKSIGLIQSWFLELAFLPVAVSLVIFVFVTYPGKSTGKNQVTGGSFGS